MRPALIHEHKAPNVEVRGQPSPQSSRSLVAFGSYGRLFLSGHSPGSLRILRLIVASETSTPISSEKASQCSLRVRSEFLFRCSGSHRLNASPLTEGLPGILWMSRSPVWRLLFSQRLMVERETPKSCWTSLLGMPRSMAASALNLRSFEYAFMWHILTRVRYLRKPLLELRACELRRTPQLVEKRSSTARPEVRASRTPLERIVRRSGSPLPPGRRSHRRPASTRGVARRPAPRPRSPRTHPPPTTAVRGDTPTPRSARPSGETLPGPPTSPVPRPRGPATLALHRASRCPRGRRGTWSRRCPWAAGANRERPKAHPRRCAAPTTRRCPLALPAHRPISGDPSRPPCPRHRPVARAQRASGYCR